MDADTTRGIDWIAADNALRYVLNGESGPLMHEAVELMLDDLRSTDPDDRDDMAHEVANRAVPDYTYQRAQMFAESLHHVTFDSELAQPTTDPVELMGTILYEILHSCAGCLIENEV